MKFLSISIAACWAAMTVQSFSHSGGNHVMKHNKKFLDPIIALHEHSDKNFVHYGMGGQNLSRRWIDLVREGHVTATTVLDENGGDDGLHVRYGVRLEEGQQQRLLEFVEIVSTEEEHGNSKLRDRILSINATLAGMQQFESNDNGLAIQCIYEGPYAAQLQLVRTLRPPRSKAMSSNSNEKASCQPPPYDKSKDSFLVGPLRLFGHGREFHGDGQPRERAARLLVSRGGNTMNGESSSKDVPWDVYHNISPVDPRGHFLILPALDDEREWRDQSLNPNDCYDVSYLASTIEPPQSLVLAFNSVQAGASQNHLHCHAWVCPPPPLRGGEDTSEQTSGYAVTKALETSSLTLLHGVTVSLLDYPCTCIKLSASPLPSNEMNNSGNPDFLKEMGEALSRIILIAQEMDVPHNVAWTNTDTYIFLRKSETSDVVDDGFNLGASEMLGVFHSNSKEQLESLSNNMVNILSDVSWEPRQRVWTEVCKAFEK